MPIMPLHPMVIHFPIVAAFGAMLLYLLAAMWPRPAIARAAAITALVAALAAVAAVRTGDQAYEDVEAKWKAVPEDVLEGHEEAGERAMYALVVLGLAAVAAWGLGGHSRRAVLAALGLLHVGAMAQVGYAGGLGGELVYSHGAGVEPLKGIRDLRRLRMEQRRLQTFGDREQAERPPLDVPTAPQPEPAAEVLPSEPSALPQAVPQQGGDSRPQQGGPAAARPRDPEREAERERKRAEMDQKRALREEQRERKREQMERRRGEQTEERERRQAERDGERERKREEMERQRVLREQQRQNQGR